MELAGLILADAEQRARRDFANLVHILAEQTAASLEAADAVLRDSQRDRSAARIAATVPRLRDELMHIPQVAAFLVVDANGKILPRDDRRRMYSLANRLWHTDGSFQDPAGRYSTLFASVIPPVRSDTEFAGRNEEVLRV